MQIVNDYIAKINSGEVAACAHVKNAVARYEQDRANGWRFNDQLAQHALDFIEQLVHTTGDYAGRNFTLEPWQAFAGKNDDSGAGIYIKRRSWKRQQYQYIP